MSGFWARYTLCSQKPDIYRCIRIRQAWILYRFSAFFSARKVTTVSGRLPAWCCMVVIFSCMFLELSSHAAWHAKYRCQVTTPTKYEYSTSPGQGLNLLSWRVLLWRVHRLRRMCGSYPLPLD